MESPNNSQKANMCVCSPEHSGLVWQRWARPRSHTQMSQLTLTCWPGQYRTPDTSHTHSSGRTHCCSWFMTFPSGHQQPDTKQQKKSEETDNHEYTVQSFEYLQYITTVSAFMNGPRWLKEAVKYSESSPEKHLELWSHVVAPDTWAQVKGHGAQLCLTRPAGQETLAQSSWGHGPEKHICVQLGNIQSRWSHLHRSRHHYRNHKSFSSAILRCYCLLHKTSGI